MAKEREEKKEETLTRREKSKLKESIIEEIETDVKSEIVTSVIEDVKKSFDREYKEEIKQALTKEVKEDIKESIWKEQKKLLRHKNFKIVRLTLYVFLLLLTSVYAIYCLYRVDQLEVLKNPREILQTTTSKVTTTTELMKDLEWYKNEYGYLLDTVQITNLDLYKGNYKISSLEEKEKLALAYKNLKADKIEKEGIIRTIKEADLVDAYQALFGSDQDYKGVDFAVEGVNFAYRSQYGEYISVDKNDTKEKIVQQIIEIKEEKNKICFVTIVGILKNNHLYNVIDDTLVAEKYNEEDLEQYVKKLSKMEYQFTKKGSEYFISEWTGK